MKKTFRSLLKSIIILLFLLSLNILIISSVEQQNVMQIITDLALNHPRRGHSLTLIGDKIWVTGGRAYESHFSKWGKEKFQKFNPSPNVEIMDLKTGKTIYTNIEIPNKYYKSAAFRINENDKFIYLAQANAMGVIDTENMTFKELPKDSIGVLADWNSSRPGLMTIKGKKYIVLLGGDASVMSYFDVEQKKFVTLDGLPVKIKYGSVGGVVYENKFYYAGGSASDDDNGGLEAFVFDPNDETGNYIKQLANLPVPLKNPAAAFVKNKIYYMGGPSAGDMSSYVIEYNPATNKYVRKTDLPRGAVNHACVVVNDKIYISWGYSWGTVEEERPAARNHPEITVIYQPLIDNANPLSYDAKILNPGKSMNITLSFTDADKITGSNQSISLSWLAGPKSTYGKAYYRVKGTNDYEIVKAAGSDFETAGVLAKGYVAVLNNLKPDTQYEYYVVSEGPETVKSNIYNFKTQPEKTETFQFYITGDSKSEFGILNLIYKDMFDKIKEAETNKITPAFSGLTGDLTSYGTIKEYDGMFSKVYPYIQKAVTEFPIVSVMGNHETDLPAYWNSFESPRKAMNNWPPLNNKGKEEYWSSFNYGSLHFISLTTGIYLEQEWFSKRQLEWLKEDLAYAKKQKQEGKIDYVVIMLHHDFFTSTEHLTDLDSQGLQKPGMYLDVIEQSGAVDVVISAHDHYVERTKNIAGYRWKKEEGKDPVYEKLSNAFAEEGSGRYGEATQGKGTVFITMGSAGAAQRETFSSKKLGDYSWSAFRKPEPDLRGESYSKQPFYGFAIFTVTKIDMLIEIYETDCSSLTGYVDDNHSGIVDSLYINRVK